MSLEVVGLSEDDVQYGVRIGKMRQANNVSNGRSDAHGFRGNGEALHVAGSLAELAVARHLDLPWSEYVEDPFSLEADVGESLQIRSTSHRSGRLIVHQGDPDEAVFILVIALAEDQYGIAGGIRGRRAKDPAWWTDPTGKNRPAFFVPQTALRPLDPLKVR